MEAIKVFLKLVRFPNILINVLSQYLIRFCIIFPVFKQAEQSFYFKEIDFAILVFAFVCLGAAGYIINDILDFEVDKINKKQKLLIGNQITQSQAYKYYWISNLLGVIASIYLSLQYDSPYFIIGFLALAASLYLYSSHLQKMILVGNILVAGLCALAIWMVFQIEFPNFLLLEASLAKKCLLSISIYTAFAYFLTLYREIVKDMEDVEGDKANGYKTLSVLFGIKSTRWVAAFIALIVFLMLLAVGYYYAKNEMYFHAILILIPSALLFYSRYKLMKAEKPTDLQEVSNLIKMSMLAGILYLPFLATIL